MTKAHVTVTDLWRDSNGGWEANGCWMRRYEMEIPDGWSDRKVARRLRALAGITGRYWRKDEWSGAEMSWRNGTVGAYVDYTED